MIQIRRTFFIIILCLNFSILSRVTLGAEKDIEIEWFKDFEASFGYNDNIGQSVHNRDINGDEFALLNISLLSNIEFGDSKAITLKMFAEHEQINTVNDLSRSSIGAQFSYRWQRTLGYLAPFYQFNTSIQLNEYGVDQRNSTVSNTQLFMTKRISDSMSFVAGLAHYLEDSEGTVFDLKHNRLFLNLDYSPGTSNIYYASYGYRKGDIWSVAQAVFCNGDVADDIFPLIAAADAREPDEAFNNAYCGQWIAYRLEADTHTAKVGINIAFGRRSTLDFSVLFISSEATSDINYQSSVIRASYLARF